MTVRVTLRNRVGRLLRIQAFRLHRWADRIDPHPRRLVEAGLGRRSPGHHLDTTIDGGMPTGKDET